MVDCCFCFCKQKTAYEMRISDWSSDVCSSDLALVGAACNRTITPRERIREAVGLGIRVTQATRRNIRATASIGAVAVEPQIAWRRQIPEVGEAHFDRSEERRVGKECVSGVDLGGCRMFKKKNKEIKKKN